MTSDVKSVLLRNPEGWIFIIGAGSTGIFMFFLASLFIWHTDVGEIWSLLGIRLVAGRSGGLYSGFVMDLSPGWVFFINIMVEILWILIFAPLALMALHKAISSRWIESFIRRRKTSVDKYGKFMRGRSGTVALFIFIVLPIPLSGPIVGSMIADFLKYPLRKNMTLVISAAFTSILLWSVLVYFFQSWMEQYGKAMQWSLLGVFILMSALPAIYRKIKNSKRFA